MDRWDQKQVLVVSDILRAALVLLIPVAVLINVWLAYPLVFLITTVSIFFRPARVTILPRLVPDQDLLSANSAMWVGETLADVVNYPIAGLFVVFLAGSLPIAFWFDAATYLVLGGAPVHDRRAAGALRTGCAARVDGERAGRRRDADDGTTPSTPRRRSAPTSRPAGPSSATRPSCWRTRCRAPQASSRWASSRCRASCWRSRSRIPRATSTAPRTRSWRPSIGLGNLIGGFVLGMVATRVRKGPLVIAAYTVFGALVFLVGLADSIPLVLGLLFGVGVANMAFVIPSQTLFQERTPPELMGRVVSLRFALVFGGMSMAMAVGGLLVSVFGPGPVIAARRA